MRLLVVTQDFPPDVGGIQTYSWEIGRRLAARVADLHVIAPRRPGAPAVDRQAPFPVTRVAGRPDLLPLTALGAVLQEARRLHPTVAFHAQWQTVGASIVARALTGWPRRIACAAHGRELLFNPLPHQLGLDAAYGWFRRWTVSHVDGFFPVSRYTAGLLRRLGVPDNRLHVVPNGTDPERFRPGGRDAVRRRRGLGERPVLLTVGRLVPRKGIDTVLRALPTIIAAVPDVAYLVAGTGPDRERLEQLARHLDVLDAVRFLGHVAHEELPAHYSAADLFVMPAREAPPDVEGFGLVFLEANACGTPVVGARTGGIPDAIVDGETGMLVPPSDPDTLARAITGLLSDPERLARLGEQGRAHAVHAANWDRIVDTLLARLMALE